MPGGAAISRLSHHAGEHVRASRGRVLGGRHEACSARGCAHDSEGRRRS
ncbi:hypothetical protein ACFPRL_34250 [Pseudoclavibacter helvolus]